MSGGGAHPARGAHNWLIFRLIEPALRDALASYARGRLADVGCGAKPWAALAQPFVAAHVGFDRGRGADVRANAHVLPAASGTFATLLCTDVLEHLEEPGDAIREAFRVLEPGGHAIYTVPLHWHLHEEPRDFYRFTSHGLRYLFEKHGFEVLEIRALTGLVASTAQAWAYRLRQLGLGRCGPLRALAALLVQLVQALGLWIHRFDRSPRHTAEYLAVVRKPAR
jgi:SAM-dependent methyltransferase